MLILKRIFSLVLIMELLLQPILGMQVRASDPVFKQEGDFKYYEVKRPSDALSLDLPEDALYGTDLDLTLMQCHPNQRQKYVQSPYPMDDKYLSWITQSTRKWMVITARYGVYHQETLEQLQSLGVHLNAFDGMLKPDEKTFLDESRFIFNNVVFATEEKDHVLHKGICLKNLLDRAKDAGFALPDHFVFFDDNLDELRKMSQVLNHKKLTLIHVNNNAILRGYPQANHSFPQTIFDLRYVKTFDDGRVGAVLLEDIDERKFALKPLGRSHELFCELTYRAMGEPAPDLALYWHLPYEIRDEYSLADGPFRLAEYIEAAPLQDRNEMIKQSGPRLALDAFLANFDSVTSFMEDGKEIFDNQILGLDGLVHPVDMGAGGIYVHEGVLRLNDYPLHSTIKGYCDTTKFSSAEMYKGATESIISTKLRELYDNRHLIFGAFQTARTLAGMDYEDELHHFLTERFRDIQHILQLAEPHDIWQGRSLSQMDFSGAGIYLISGNNVLLGVRKNGDLLGNLGGLSDEYHQYAHFTAAQEVHEETAGGICVDPVKLLNCPRFNDYTHKPFNDCAWDELFRYTIFFYPMEPFDLQELNARLAAASREEEQEITQLLLVPLTDLIHIGASETIPGWKGLRMFEPFLRSLRIMVREGLMEQLLDFDNPLSVDCVQLHKNFSEPRIYKRPLNSPSQPQLIPNRLQELGDFVGDGLKVEEAKPAEESMLTPAKQTSSVHVLNHLTGDLLPLESRIFMAVNVKSKPLQLEDNNSLDITMVLKEKSYIKFLTKVVEEESLHPHDHFMYHGTTGRVGFQWLAMTTLNRIQGLSSLRLRAVEVQADDHRHAHQFASHMVKSGIHEDHYSPGHQESWMAVALSLFHCPTILTSSPIEFCYTGSSRTSLGDSMTILERMYGHLQVTDTARDMLLAGYDRVYRKFFDGKAGKGCMLQLWTDPESIDQKLYLTGDLGVAAVTDDDQVPRASEFLKGMREDIGSLPKLKCTIDGETHHYDAVELRGQLLATPAGLANVGYKFHFWQDLNFEALSKDLGNLIRMHLFVILPKLVSSPVIYKEPAPLALEVQRRFQIKRRDLEPLDQAEAAASALMDHDLRKLYDICAATKDLYRAKFYQPSHKKYMTLMEYAREEDKTKPQGKYAEILLPFINYFYSLSVTDRKNFDESVDAGVPQLLPYQKILLLPLAEDALPYAKACLRPYQNADTINRIIMGITRLTAVPLDLVCQVVGLCEEDLQNELDNSILTLVEEIDRNQPYIDILQIRNIVKLSEPIRIWHPQALVSMILSDSATAKPFADVWEQFLISRADIRPDGVLLTRTICMQVLPTYFAEVIWIAHQLGQAYERLHDLFYKVVMRPQVLNLVNLDKLRNLFEITRMLDLDGPKLYIEATLLHACLLEILMETSTHEEVVSRRERLLQLLRTIRLDHKKIPILIMGGLLDLNQGYCHEGTTARLVHSLMVNLPPADLTTGAVTILFQALKDLDHKDWPDFDEILMRPEGLWNLILNCFLRLPEINDIHQFPNIEAIEHYHTEKVYCYEDYIKIFRALAWGASRHHLTLADFRAIASLQFDKAKIPVPQKMHGRAALKLADDQTREFVALLETLFQHHPPHSAEDIQAVLSATTEGKFKRDHILLAVRCCNRAGPFDAPLRMFRPILDAMPDELSGIGLDFFELVIRHYGDLRPEFQLKIYDGTDHKHHWEFLGRMAPVLKTLTRETDNIEDILSLIDYCHHGPYAEMHCAMAQEVETQGLKRDCQMDCRNEKTGRRSPHL